MLKPDEKSVPVYCQECALKGKMIRATHRISIEMYSPIDGDFYCCEKHYEKERMGYQKKIFNMGYGFKMNTGEQGGIQVTKYSMSFRSKKKDGNSTSDAKVSENKEGREEVQGG